MSLDSPNSRAKNETASLTDTEIERVLEHVAHILPAQGPISIFVHHNALHAFEGRRFETAVVQAASLFGCEAWLSEERYHRELESGRIEEDDLVAVLADDLGATAQSVVGGLATRLELRRIMLRHLIEEPPVSELDWLLAEADLLECFRLDASKEARRRVVEGTRRSLERALPTPSEEQTALQSLFKACVRVTERCGPRPIAPTEHVRHRDWLLEATGHDSDGFVHPLLIRVCAAYLDQGLASWRMPETELGLLRCFRRLYAAPAAPPGRFMAELRRLLDAEERADRSTLESIRDSLSALGVEPRELVPFLRATLLALRGWAGMVRQVERRPDRVPVRAPPAKLADFLAVRLLMERAALSCVARDHAGFVGPLGELRAELRARRRPHPAEPQKVRAFVLFQVAQLLGRSAAEIDELHDDSARAVLREIESLDENERRRLLHRAYERRYRVEMLDALMAHTLEPQSEQSPPRFQAVLCIDEREESLRRHLEEAAPDCETYGVAGFFGVAMYYRGTADARPMPLCPIALRPEVEVEEDPVEELRTSAARRARMRQVLGRLVLGMSAGSRTFTRGAVMTALVGTLAALPLVFRVLFPRSTAWIRERALRLLGPPDRTRLRLARRDGVEPLLGARAGFSVDEMATIVRRLLEESGLGRSLSPLVVLVGHGSSSLNNPHESAHDCGACGGGRGGPNARAFAQMANDPRVRALLAEQGIQLPESTVFVGAYHDTCDDSVQWFDLDVVPAERRAELGHVRATFDTARTRNAHERCRRFEGVPSWFPPDFALSHVEARSEDLAQVRPEYGHATNAACIVGRRSRTRGLFLDRRVFLVSYDSTLDDEEGTLLSRVLSAVVPVTAGINLEYYLSHVDRRGYGCDTKLPHNIASLLGVMDGHASDLRTGLPWQMVEIHEPVRLLLVVEASPDQLTFAISNSEAVRRVVQGGWIQVAALDPTSERIVLLDDETSELVPYVPESRELPVARSSIDWYGGRAEHLRCARITDRAPASVPNSAPLFSP